MIKYYCRQEVIIIYKIGEFAEIVDANIKTIRYYDEIDLLKPKEIDKFTSYRYYNEDNIREFHSIRLLKKLGFSLEEIKKYKDNLNDEIFLRQRDKLIKDILDKKQLIKIIDETRKNIVDGKITLDDYEIKNIETKKKRYGGNYNE